MLTAVAALASCQSPTYSRLAHSIQQCEASTCRDSRQDDGVVDVEGGREGGGADASVDQSDSDVPPRAAPDAGVDASDKQDGVDAMDAATDTPTPADATTLETAADAPTADLPPPPGDAAEDFDAFDAADGSPGDSSSPPDGSAGQCSSRGGPQVTLTFQNSLPTTTVTFNWVDFACKEVEYAQVAPGNSYQVSTFGAHAWRVRDPFGLLLKEFTVAVTPTKQRVTVP